MTPAPHPYPGERLGLPESGPGSIARVGRRIAALFIDYLPAVVIAGAFFPLRDRGDVTPIPVLDADPMYTLLVFAVLQIIFIPTLGGSIGHRIMGLRLMRADGAWTGVWRPIVRTLLLCIVIPAVIWDQDQRGLHDKMVATILVRAR